MAGVVKWNRNNLRKFEKEMTKEMNKRIANVNRKIDPIRLSAESPSSLGSGISISTTNNDNRIRIDGDIHNSQIGGAQNHQQVNNSVDIEGILREIRELSKTITDKSDLDELTTIINELQNSKGINDNHGAFFEKHPLIAVGMNIVVSWAATHGLDKLAPILQHVFTGAGK